MGWTKYAEDNYEINCEREWEKRSPGIFSIPVTAYEMRLMCDRGVNADGIYAKNSKDSCR